MYETFRVIHPFRWRGWHYGPGQHIAEVVDQSTGQPAACDCDFYGGDIWVVEEGHPRKAWALEQRKVRYELGLRPTKYATDDEWIAATPNLKRLTMPPPSATRANYTPPEQRRRHAAVAVE